MIFKLYNLYLSKDLINKQAESEADLLKSIKNIDDQVGARTKNDEFNPFR